MKKFSALSFLREHWILVSTMLVYIVINLAVMSLVGAVSGTWQAIYPGFLMVSLVLIFSGLIGFLFEYIDIFARKYILLLFCLLILGSGILIWPGLAWIYISVGFFVALFACRIIFTEKYILGFTTYGLYLIYLYILNSLGRFIANEQDLNSSLLSLIRILVVGAVIPIALHFIVVQSNSIRNRVQIFIFTFCSIPLLILISKFNTVLASLHPEPQATVEIIAISSLGFLFLVVIVFFISRYILKPINQLAIAIEKEDSADFGNYIDIHSRDEIGMIAQAVNTYVDHIRTLSAGIELRITERTYNLERRFDQLYHASEIARELTSIKDIEELYNRSVTLIEEHFGFDQVLLYITDDRKENVNLAAVAGFNIDELIEKEVRFRVGNPDPVGTAASNGRPKIIEDSAIYGFSPHFPQTRSRMVIPLQVGIEMVGVIDIHSVEINKFDENLLEVIKVVTNQLALSIEQVREYQKLKYSIRELELLSGQYTHQSWQNAQRLLGVRDGYVYRGSVVRRSDTQPLQTPGEKTKPSPSILSISLRVRDKEIGKINFKFDEPDPDPNVIETIQEMTQRLSLIMENARLIMEARYLAGREQQINQITTEVRNSVSVESILRNTVQELGKSFGASRAFVQIGIVPENPVEETPSQEIGGDV